MQHLADVRVRSIASTPYDTAWVAAVPDPLDRRDPRFPTALNWIAANQWPDGSWGSEIPYLHDRIICTLAALIPLARYGRREQDAQMIRRGERYLWQNAHLLETQQCELVGFELLLPTLIETAISAGVHLPPYIYAFEGERTNKLKMLPEKLLYSPHVTIAHSLEFLGSSVDPLQLVSVRAANGSIGNSPAATAFLLHYLDDQDAVDYLERCLADDSGEAVPVLEPCETFDALWSAQHRWLGGTPATELLVEPLRSVLEAGLQGKGVSLSPSFPIPDADETAVALLLFYEAGIAITSSALELFERDDYFVSFPYERHPSTGVNIHALMTLHRYRNYPNRDNTIAKILRFLAGNRQQGSFWTDKWHISPLYATGRAIVALSEVDGPNAAFAQELLAPSLAWVLKTQNEDGSWGAFDIPTAEETAYALLALHCVPPSEEVMSAISAGYAYLVEHTSITRPAMWIDKCLYYPTRIVESAIQAALQVGEHTFELVYA
jgi:halimadienyl-diphosphate synthase